MSMIAISVPEDISEQLSKLSVPGEKLKDNEKHITLFYFEKSLSPKNILDISDLICQIISKISPFQIKLKEITSFPKGEDGVPIIIPIDCGPLKDLRARLAAKFDKNDIKYSKKFPEFKPHLTLSYADKEMKDKKIDKLLQWKVGEICFYGGDEMDDGLRLIIPFGISKTSSIYLQADLFEMMIKNNL